MRGKWDWESYIVHQMKQGQGEIKNLYTPCEALFPEQLSIMLKGLKLWKGSFMLLSIVVPVYNEEASLKQLHNELIQVAHTHNFALDMIFVDDGSRDQSWSVIAELAQHDNRVRGIRFRRNFGKAAALSAGFAVARGEFVATLDADLQDDPHELPRFLEQMQSGADVVSGWKQCRHDPWHKRWPSKVFNGLVSWFTGVRLHDHNCGFKCYRREIFQEVKLYGEMHRFVPVLAAARGWKVSELIVNHRPRVFGESKYGFRRFIKGFLDLLTVYFLTGFHQRPAHLLGSWGLFSFALGGLGMVYLTCYWIARQTHPEWNLEPLHTRPALLYSVAALLLGVQLIIAGFLAELIIAFQSGSTLPYSVRERVGETVPSTEKDAPHE
jgi:glycosyltransferase involved in cell wall biosynthesis